MDAINAWLNCIFAGIFLFNWEQIVLSCHIKAKLSYILSIHISASCWSRTYWSCVEWQMHTIIPFIVPLYEIITVFLYFFLLSSIHKYTVSLGWQLTLFWYFYFGYRLEISWALSILLTTIVIFFCNPLVSFSRNYSYLVRLYSIPA